MPLRILLPYDFSAAANNALKYCLALKAKLPISISVMHIVHPVVDLVGVASQVGYQIPYEGKKQELQESLMELTQGEEWKEIALLIKEGYEVDQITQQADEEDFDLIVMGTKGAVLRTDYIFGSLTTSVIENTTKPVLVIPQGASYRPIDRITYACSLDSADAESVKTTLKLAEIFRADTDWVHIHPRTSNYSTEMQNVLVSQMFGKFFGAEKPQIQFLKKDTIWEGLLSFTKDKGSDWLVLVRKPKSFWYKLTHANPTKQVALHADMPLLVLAVAN